MSVSNSLRMKYGLEHSPSEVEISKWVEETERLMNLGHSPEESGEKAAKAVFPDFGTMIYKAQADTIIALLDAAKKRK
jgi:hypothetical protein